jgi:hypothetical protein
MGRKQETNMEYYYQFLDRDPFNQLLKMSWKEFLRKWGRTPWARRAATGDGYGSLREFIAFSLSPEPSPEEVEAILSLKTIRWTIQRSSPQLAAMAGLIDCVPALRRHSVCVGFFKRREFSVLLAAAVEAYLGNRISRALMLPLFKIHSVADANDWLCLSREQRQALKAAVSLPEICRPIYRWQGSGFLEGEEWASCLGVADTRRLITCVEQAWRENWPVSLVKDLSETSAPAEIRGSPRFRDFSIAEEFTKALKTKLMSLDRPVVFFRSD